MKPCGCTTSMCVVAVQHWQVKIEFLPGKKICRPSTIFRIDLIYRGSPNFKLPLKKYLNDLGQDIWIAVIFWWFYLIILFTNQNTKNCGKSLTSIARNNIQLT